MNEQNSFVFIIAVMLSLFKFCIRICCLVVENVIFNWLVQSFDAEKMVGKLERKNVLLFFLHHWFLLSSSNWQYFSCLTLLWNRFANLKPNYQVLKTRAWLQSPRSFSHSPATWWLVNYTIRWTSSLWILSQFY